MKYRFLARCEFTNDIYREYMAFEHDVSKAAELCHNIELFSQIVLAEYMTRQLEILIEIEAPFLSEKLCIGGMIEGGTVFYTKLLRPDIVSSIAYNEVCLFAVDKPFVANTVGTYLALALLHHQKVAQLARAIKLAGISNSFATVTPAIGYGEF